MHGVRLAFNRCQKDSMENCFGQTRHLPSIGTSHGLILVPNLQAENHENDGPSI